LWWSYSSPVAGSLRIDFSALSFTPLVGIYTGTTLAAVKPVTNFTDYVKHQTVFNAFPGTNYLIQFDGYRQATGDILLHLDFQPLPPNDNFSNRSPFPRAPFSTNANNRGATEEPGEPKHAGLSGGHSLWWSWTPSVTENVTLAAAGDGFSTHLAVYRGSALKALVTVASNYVGQVLQSGVTFNAIQGTNYQIAVDSDVGEFGHISMSLAPTPAPLNDNFSNAIALSGFTFSTTGSTIAATTEPGEPSHAGSPPSHSIWWEWTPSVSGPVTIDTGGSSFDTVLAVYTGSSLTNLTTIASNDDAPNGGSTSQVTFNAIAGISYLMAVDGFAGSSGEVQLNITEPGPAPLQYSNIRTLPTGQFGFTIIGTQSQLFEVQMSTNLVDWRSISTNQFIGSTTNVAEPIDQGSPNRFYRVVPWP
jgi:hypothetical protein